jgi:hypothetical protein
MSTAKRTGRNVTVVKRWWVEHRWMLTKTTLYTLDCLIILLIPTMHSPYNYVSAIFVVISLAIFFRDFSATYRHTHSQPPARSFPAHRSKA